MTSATSRGLLFAVAAESCERFRPGYPDEVVDRTLAFAQGPVDRAVEIDAGTGKATRAFASRGVTVTALEPDPDMFSVLQRETLGMPVEPVLADLGSYDGPHVGLVYAASWDRIGPERTVAAGLLSPGGVLAVFSSRMWAADPVVQQAVAVAGDDSRDDPAFQPSGVAAVEHRRLVDDALRAHPLLTDVCGRRLGRRLLLPQREYVGYLSTLPAYLRLSLDDRQDLLQRVVQAVPAQVPVEISVDLHLARRI